MRTRKALLVLVLMLSSVSLQSAEVLTIGDVFRIKPHRHNGRVLGYEITDIIKIDPSAHGLKIGDVIVRFDGKSIFGPTGSRALAGIREFMKKQEVRLALLRDGKQIELYVVLNGA